MSRQNELNRAMAFLIRFGVHAVDYPALIIAIMVVFGVIYG